MKILSYVVLILIIVLGIWYVIKNRSNPTLNGSVPTATVGQ